MVVSMTSKTRGRREPSYRGDDGPAVRESWLGASKKAGEQLPAPKIAIVPDAKALLAQLYKNIGEVFGGEPALSEVLQLTADVVAVFDHLSFLEDAAHKRGADFSVDPEEARAAWARRDALSTDLERLFEALERLRGPLKQEAAHREEQARCLVAYDHARDLCETAAEMMERAQVEWNAALAKAAHAVTLAHEANAALPHGFAALTIPPICADEQVISHREVERWCVDGTTKTFDDVEVVPPNHPRAPGVLMPRQERVVVRRFFREVTYRRRGSSELHTRYEAIPQPVAPPEPMGTPASERDLGVRGVMVGRQAGYRI